MASLDLPFLQKWIGRKEQATDVVSLDLTRRFNATFSDVGARDDIGAFAPLGIHWCLASTAASTDKLDVDGHPKRGDFLPPVPLPRRMWAGCELEFFAPLRIGSDVLRRSTVLGVSEKIGRSGPLCFVKIAHDYISDNEVSIRQRDDLVYREASTSQRVCLPVAEKDAKQVDKADYTDPVLLFRYSALTFNGHRIHYDRDYAVRQEGYSGLVVHGPLQATLLLRHAASLRGGVCPRQFILRGSRALIDTDGLKIGHQLLSDGLKLWTSDALGREAMLATARW